MNKEKATIYDLWRMCRYYGTVCSTCPLRDKDCGLEAGAPIEEMDEINEIIHNWCKGHPVKTRQDKFLEMFPNADVSLGYLDICPMKVMGADWNPDEFNCTYTISQIRQIEICENCLKSYWLAEVEENE